jgi:hypothetical protein
MAAGESGPAKVLSRRVKWAAAVILAACLIAFLGFLAGEHHQRPATTTVLSGIATVGYQEATVVVAGWAYGIEGSLTWVDQNGVTHEAGWPACLGAPGGTARITFGEVPATTPDGGMVRQVVWVDCRS